MANSSDDEKQTKRFGKVPKICAADQFIFWEASFDTYLGDECVEAIKSAKPLEDEAIEVGTRLLGPSDWTIGKHG